VSVPPEWATWEGWQIAADPRFNYGNPAHVQAFIDATQRQLVAGHQQLVRGDQLIHATNQNLAEAWALQRRIDQNLAFTKAATSTAPGNGLSLGLAVVAAVALVGGAIVIRGIRHA
jgi:hypothetical protein